MNILYLTNELNYVDGVSSHLYYLINNLKNEKKISLFLICGGGDAIEKFNEIDIKIIVNKNINHDFRNIKNFTSSILSVYNFVKNNNIELIHSHNHYAANIANKAANFSNVKTIQTNHGFISEGGRLKHFSANKYITVNKHIYNYFINNKIAENKNVYLIYNGVDFKEENIIKNKNHLRIIAASRLEKGKGLDTFIRAINKIPDEYKKVTEFIIAGEGSLERDLKNLDKELGTGIKFMGRQKNLRTLLNKTDIFVFPTNSTEGLPMTIIEAAASKNLIIYSNFKGAEDILQPGIDGLMFEMNNADDLTGKIKFAIENPELLNKMSKSFYLKAIKRFNAKTMSEKHLSLYYNTLNEI